MVSTKSEQQQRRPVFPVSAKTRNNDQLITNSQVVEVLLCSSSNANHKLLQTVLGHFKPLKQRLPQIVKLHAYKTK